MHEINNFPFKIGQFLEKGMLMEGRVYDILNSHYASVFSNPIKETMFDDPLTFPLFKEGGPYMQRW